jgi:eukaryotic-like serine/threonine-protein kinase
MSIVERRQRGDDSGGATSDAPGDQPPTWTRVKALFLEALEQPDSERSAFVARSAGSDAGLRNEVDSLLASEAAADSLCETPAACLLHSSPGPEAEPTARLQPGARLGVYEISDFVAAGGMGAVYRARHTLLARQVAIKTVVEEFPDPAAKRRLIREARHASLLSHPNICAVHDVGEVEGTPFIVMEYVAGTSLGTLIREAIPSRTDALRFGIQIANALDHAHRHGIIHRDLKSSNVVVDEAGNAIVLDFGLARRLPEPGVRGDSTATGGEAFAGTLSHMAPEVLRGEPADARSDVWALGILLYELLTGRLPFSGRTPFETSSAILGESAPPMSVSVPLALRLIVERCLVKDPEGRYQSAQAVAESLDAVRRHRSWPLVGRLLVSGRRRMVYGAAGAALLLVALFTGGRSMLASVSARLPGRISTVAVLPLENATGDSAAAFYANGIGDALVAQLGAISDIHVLSRTSLKRVVANDGTPREIGGRLAADVIVRGALRRANDSIAIDISLVRPSDGRVLWTQEHQRSVRDVLALEAQIVRALADSLRLTALPGARERLETIRAVSPDVYEAYLMGRYEWDKRTRTSLERAITHFTRATELDPSYAPAHAALADCFNQLGTVMLGKGSPTQYRPRAISEAIKALQLDPYSAEAHAALGYALHYDLRWTEAEQELRRAIALNPSYSLAHIWYANLLMSRLRMREAIAQVFAARDLDPYSLIINTNVGWVLKAAGRHDAAIAQLRQALALDSEYVQARWRLAGALTEAGRFPEAREQVDRVIVLTDSSPSALAMRVSVDARDGRLDAARALLDKLLIRARHEYVPAGPIALAFEALGEDDSALVWIDKAVAERSNAIAYLAVDYRNTSLERDPRFRRVLRRAGLQ